MHTITFIDTEVAPTKDGDLGIRFIFRCNQCSKNFHIETYDYAEGNKILDAIDSDNKDGLLYCKNCLEQQIILN